MQSAHSSYALFKRVSCLSLLGTKRKAHTMRSQYKTRVFDNRKPDKASDKLSTETLFKVMFAAFIIASAFAWGVL